MAKHDDLDNYYVDLDDDEIFGPSTPEPSKKRKEPDSGLGIDQEVTVQKRPRVPNVKLDEERLLGPMGIPKLKARAAGLKLKGKGHEFSDAARLLSFYQLWLDDLFPKARFIDALKMVEKAGHKKKLQVARQAWISQAAPRQDDPDDIPPEQPDQPEQPEPDRQTPPPRNADADVGADADPDVPDEEDLYDATPRATRITKSLDTGNGDPDEDLEALMAEAEVMDARQPGSRDGIAAEHGRGEEDDLDALIAEAEAEDGLRSKGSGDVPPEQDEFADDEDAMREMEGW